jgi:hypothetical protein
MLVVNAAFQRRKVQCPKCREVIALPAPTAEPLPESGEKIERPNGDAPVPPAGTPTEARLSALEERLARVEAELGSLKAAAELSWPKPAPLSPPEVSRDVTPAPAAPALKRFAEHAAAPAAAPGPKNGHAVGGPSRPVAGEPLDPGVVERMVQTLAEVPAGRIAMQVEDGDREAERFGEWLEHVFTRSGWTVTALKAQPLPPEQQSLALLASGNYPAPKLVSTVHRAFGAAGLGLVLAIDPMSDSPVPTLIVPRRAGKAGGAALEEAAGAGLERELAAFPPPPRILK